MVPHGQHPYVVVINPAAEGDCTMFEELLNPPDFRWPKEGDRLLVTAKSPEHGARFSDDTLSRDVFLGSGYMRAGAVLVESCLADPSKCHELIYPVLFNYRHGLELAIKWVLDRYGRYAAIEEYELNHDLARLWKSCRQVIEEVGGSGGEEALEVVEGIVCEFHTLDPKSFAFRYSRDKKGSPIELPLWFIDLANVRDVMEGVSNFFMGADGQLDHNSSAMDYYSY